MMKLTDDQEKWLRKSLLEDIEPLADNAFGWWQQEAFYKNKLPDAQIAQYLLDGIDNGDPEIIDLLPYVDWSGQNADGPDWSEIFDDSWFALTGQYVEGSEGEELSDILAISDDLFLELGDGNIIDLVVKYCREVLDVDS